MPCFSKNGSNVVIGLEAWKNLRFGEIKTLNDDGKLVGVYKQNFRYTVTYKICIS